MSENDVQDMRRDVGKIFDRLTRIETMLGERCGRQADAIEENAKRLHDLEKSRAWLIGAVSVISAPGGFILRGL